MPLLSRFDARVLPGGSLLKFFSLTYVLTWTCFIATVALSGSLPTGAPLGPGLSALILLGTFAPSLVALGLTARGLGMKGLGMKGSSLNSLTHRWK
jgi:hypothetical protein